MTISKNLAVSLILAVVLLAVSILPARFKTDEMAARERLAMGTTVQIKVPLMAGEDRRRLEAKIDRAFDEIARVESVFSVYKEDSEISRINRLKKGEALKISAEAYGLIEKAIECSVKTGGAFDITVKPLVDLWADARGRGIVPSDEQVKSAVARIGSRDIVLDKGAGTIAFKKDGMALDLGGVAKGYATDRVLGILKADGISRAIIRSGGDVYCLGMRSGKDLWKVGVRHPRDRARLFMELELKDKAIDTAGDYEKFFMVAGKRYSHIIDPRTGYPIGDNVISATVVADDATTADMLATALCVLGPDGLKIADASGVMAVIVAKAAGKYKVEMAGHISGVLHVTQDKEL